MKRRLLIFATVVAVLIGLFWYRLTSRSVVIKHTAKYCTDEKGSLYSEGATLKTPDGTKQCTGGSWLPYREQP